MGKFKNTSYVCLLILSKIIDILMQYKGCLNFKKLKIKNFFHLYRFGSLHIIVSLVFSALNPEKTYPKL